MSKKLSADATACGEDGLFGKSAVSRTLATGIQSLDESKLDELFKEHNISPVSTDETGQTETFSMRFTPALRIAIDEVVGRLGVWTSSAAFIRSAIHSALNDLAGMNPNELPKTAQILFVLNSLSRQTYMAEIARRSRMIARAMASEIMQMASGSEEKAIQTLAAACRDAMSIKDQFWMNVVLEEMFTEEVASLLKKNQERFANGTKYRDVYTAWEILSATRAADNTGKNRK